MVWNRLFDITSRLSASNRQSPCDMLLMAISKRALVRASARVFAASALVRRTRANVPSMMTAIKATMNEPNV